MSTGSDRDAVSGKPSSRTQVEDESGRRPFMRGIIVHSLLSRGVGFDEAYRAANTVRDRVRSRAVVSRKELAKLVADAVGAASLREAAREPRWPTPILVTRRKGHGAPFSKGFLSQSLLAAAIEPNDAFDVARDIERQLVQRGCEEISRHDLRRLAYEALHARLGPRAAERYLVWRKYQEPDKPVILLLGGTAGVGKTSLAQEVAHRLGIGRVISTDAIRQVMRIMLSPDLVPAIHASSYDAYRVVGESESGEDAVAAAFRAQATSVCVGARAMIDRAVSENVSLVMDGVSLVPGVLDLRDYADQADVIFLIVAGFDRAAFEARFAARARHGEQRPPHRYLENLDAILRVQDHVLEQAELRGVPIVDNDSFDRSVLSIIRHVTETLRKKDEFDVADLL